MMPSVEFEIDLRSRDEGRTPEQRTTLSGRGFRAERTELRGPQTVDYAWCGRGHYLALHDITLQDGEVRVGDRHTSELRDLRQRLTYAPPGTTIEGWSSLTRRDHSYLAVSFEPDFMAELEQERPWPIQKIERPYLYFRNATLCETLKKLGRLMSEPVAPDPLMAETISLLTFLELDRALAEPRSEERRPHLPHAQLAIVLDYVESHLDKPITLDTLAGLTGLSRYHFARAFTASMDTSPVQYVRNRRIERAQSLLRTTGRDLEDIAKSVGFGGTRQFSNAFKRQVGQAPTAYRRARKS
jgi:AraC family transcriptional regulator